MRRQSSLGDAQYSQEVGAAHRLFACRLYRYKLQNLAVAGAGVGAFAAECKLAGL